MAFPLEEGSFIYKIFKALSKGCFYAFGPEYEITSKTLSGTHFHTIKGLNHMK